jgi:predicted RNA-binding Zn-ribbon protein involved in translation (DUF1610 family)
MGLTPSQPNIEFFTTECYGGPKQYNQFPGDGQHAFSIIAELFAPKSRGTVILASRDPTVNPVIDCNYLADPLDMLVLSEACRYGNEIVTQGAGTKDIVAGSWPPDQKHHLFQTREDWVPYVKQHATTCMLFRPFPLLRTILIEYQAITPPAHAQWGRPRTATQSSTTSSASAALRVSASQTVVPCPHCMADIRRCRRMGLGSGARISLRRRGICN